MTQNQSINIVQDFTDTPGARYRTDGDYSGQEFLENILKPKFELALKEKQKLVIDLSHLWGLPSSFVSGSFGLLSIEKTAKLLLDNMEFISVDNPLRIEKVINEIKNPQRK